jgi:hypothetical protein
MSTTLLTKLTTLMSFLGVSVVLSLSLLVPLTVTYPQTAHAATPPAYRYTKTFDTSVGGAYAYGAGVATDSQGNVYVTGVFHGTITFDGPGGSDTQTDAGGDRDAFLTKYNANGTYAYTKIFDTSDIGGPFAVGNGVATDPQGNVYVTGRFTGTVTFDGTGGSDTQTSGGGVRDAFITKYNANGTYAYTKTFDTSAASFVSGAGVATDAQGNVYVTGDFIGTVIFDGAGGSDSQTSADDSSFLTKYNANGSYAYTKTFDTSTSGAGAYGASVATDPQGHVYVAGGFGGTVTFDGTGGSDTQTASNSDAFITKYNADGSYVNTKIFDSSASGAFAANSGIATDAQGNVYVTGDFSGTVTFDGPGGSDSQTDANSNGDSFLTKYNANGSYAYTKIFDISASGASADGFAVATDVHGNVFVTGDFAGTVTFDGTGGSDTQAAGGGNDGSFLTQYGANGSYVATKIFDTSAGSAYADGYAVATDAQDNVYVTGDFGGTVTFDGPGGSDSRTADSSGGFFLTSFQVFTPSQPSPTPSPAATSAPAPGAPNTGFGVFKANPLRTLALCSLTSLGLIGLAIVAQRMKRAKQDV